MSIEQRDYCTECEAVSEGYHSNWEVCQCGGHREPGEYECCMGCKVCHECCKTVSSDHYEDKWCEFEDRCTDCCTCDDGDEEDEEDEENEIEIVIDIE